VKHSFVLTCAAAVWFSLIACGKKTEPAAPVETRSNAPVSAAAPAVADSRPKLVAFGDSLSAGFGADPGKSYPDYLQKLIDKDHLAYRVVNEGVSGDTTADGVERLPGVLAEKPKLVVLELGGNDGLRGLPVSSTRANLETMVSTLQKGGATVVLAGMTLPRNYGPEYIHSFERVYVDLAREKHLTRVPFLLNGVAGVERLMQRDSIHPTAEGNALVAKNVYQYIKPLL
jgi:acyl-CoA thioesterase I